MKSEPQTQSIKGCRKIGTLSLFPAIPISCKTLTSKQKHKTMVKHFALYQSAFLSNFPLRKHTCSILVKIRMPKFFVLQGFRYSLFSDEEVPTFISLGYAVSLVKTLKIHLFPFWK